MKAKKILLSLILCSSAVANINANYSSDFQEISKLACRCECFSVNYTEICLILFLIGALVYFKYKFSKSEARQEWMRKSLDIDSKKLKNVI